MNYDDERVNRIFSTLVKLVIVGTIALTICFCVVNGLINL